MNLANLSLTMVIKGIILTFSIPKFCLAADDGAILVLGDSWASLSGSFLADVCSLGSNGEASSEESRALTNNGISGSTAAQWASGNVAVESFNKGKYEYDYVWLSIGGNDFNCDESIHDEIAENIAQVISDIFESSSNDNMQVLYTGYGYPSENICGGSSDFISIFEDFSTTVRETIEDSPYADRMLTMGISSLYVTEDSEPLSDKTWYADDIHINEAGYVKLFSMNEVQEFFGCSDSGGASESSVVATSSVLAFFALSTLNLFLVNKKFGKYDIAGLSGRLLSKT